MLLQNTKSKVLWTEIKHQVTDTELECHTIRIKPQALRTP